MNVNVLPNKDAIPKDIQVEMEDVGFEVRGGGQENFITPDLLPKRNIPFRRGEYLYRPKIFLFSEEMNCSPSPEKCFYFQERGRGG